VQLATAPEYSKPLIIKTLLTAIVVACTGALAFSRQMELDRAADAAGTVVVKGRRGKVAPLSTTQDASRAVS
jgi:hypothetical protein